MPKLAVLVPLLLLTVIGCTGDDKTAPPPPPPLPSVTHPAAEVPQDRPQRAVIAALTRLDACAFLNRAKVKVPGFPATAKPVPMAPHRCRLETAGQEVDVTVGVRWDRARRFDAEAVTTGGVTTYFVKSPGGLCRAAVPVSFTYTIDFRTTAGGVRSAEKCKLVKTLAASAVTLLSDPDKLGATRPLAGWDACAVLGKALGAKVGGTPLVLGDALLEGIDRCGFGGGAVPAVQLEVEYGAPPEKGTKDKFLTVNGKKVRVYEIPQCHLAWNQAPSQVASRPAAVVTVTAATCTEATALVKSVMAVLNGPEPAAVAPQRPVVIRAGEPDLPATGACVDLPAEYRCEPYHEVSAPKGVSDVTRGAAADHNVDCAIAIEAVRRHLGPTLKPATSTGESDGPATDGGCVFVEPTHATQVWISVAASPKDGTLMGDEGRNPVNVSLKDRAGTKRDHSAARVAGVSITVPLTEDANGPVLQGKVLQHHPRGTTSDATPAADSTRKLDPVLSEILTDYLS